MHSALVIAGVVSIGILANAMHDNAALRVPNDASLFMPRWAQAIGTLLACDAEGYKCRPGPGAMRTKRKLASTPSNIRNRGKGLNHVQELRSNLHRRRMGRTEHE
jgi:hypothetical protein